MTSKADDCGVSLGQWNALIRRARLTDRQKLAALLLSSYADTNGQGIHCGASRFAVDLGCSYATARRYLAWMRDVGLIELTQSGSSKAKRADEYRLILGPDLLERIQVLNPAQYKAVAKDVREVNKLAQQSRRERAEEAKKGGHERSAMLSAHEGVETAQDGVYERSARVSADAAMSAQSETHERSPMNELPPVREHLPKEVDLPSNPDEIALRTELTLGARDGSAKVFEIRPGASSERPHWAPPPRSEEANSAVADARRAIAAAKTAHRATKEAQ